MLKTNFHNPLGGLPKISYKEFNTFLKDFYSNKYPHQRLGQAFLNKYYPESGEETAKLFYEESADLVLEIIFREFLDYDSFEIYECNVCHERYTELSNELPHGPCTKCNSVTFTRISEDSHAD